VADYGGAVVSEVKRIERRLLAKARLVRMIEGREG
jgi:hypothetical protein